MGRSQFELAPSSLVYDRQLSPDVRRLLKESRQARRRFDWLQAAGCALDACRVCEAANAHVGLALARLHLADCYSDVGEIGQAMEQAQQAHKTLERQPDSPQRHNQAIAACALGLLQELRPFRDPLDAWNWYQEALDQFIVAKEHWATRRAVAQMRICEEASQWIEDRLHLITQARIRQRSQDADISGEAESEQQHRAGFHRLFQILTELFDEGGLQVLSFHLGVVYDGLPGIGKTAKARALIAYLSHRGRIAELVATGRRERPDIPWGGTDEAKQEASAARQRQDGTGLPRQAVFTIWRSDSEAMPFARADGPHGYFTSDDRALIEGTPYLYHSVPGRPDHVPTLSISGTNYYFALPVPEDHWALPETRVGDYVFIRQQWLADEESVGVMWEPGLGWSAGDFRREPDGSIKFLYRPARITGGKHDPTNSLKGYVIGLLRPE